MHGFTWRKLIGNHGVVGGIPPEPPDPCSLCLEADCIGLTCDNYNTTYTYRVCYSSSCGDGDGGGGVDPGCNIEYCLTMTANADCPECINPPIPISEPVSPGCPQERLLEFGLPCNKPFAQTTQSSNCVTWLRNPAMGVITSISPAGGEPNPYYFLPTGETNIKSTMLCLDYGSPNGYYRRLQLISGRNRDRYGGPICAHYRKGYDPRCYFDPEWTDSFFGLTHIGYEQLSIPRGSNIASGQSQFGGTFPLEDGVLNLPLFGANSRLNPVNPECPESPCCGYGTTEQLIGCFDCRQGHNGGGVDGNEGYGHFLPRDRGSTSGYFSFGCFNAHSHLTNRRVDSAWDIPPVAGGPDRHRIEVPTCSLWAYIKGIRNYIKNVETLHEERRYGINPLTNSCSSEQFDINYVNGVDGGDGWWQNLDPGGTNSAGTSNVRLVMDELERRVEGIKVYFAPNDDCSLTAGWQLVTPKVFLWDKQAFLDASTTNRWKHIYTVGYSNILWDSGCTNTPDENASTDPPPLTGEPPTLIPPGTIRNELIHLDNVSHAVGVNAANASRLLGWVGCDGNPSDAYFFLTMRTMQCNGSEHGLTPSSGFNELDCTDCRKDLNQKNCVSDAFWPGFSNSVTACDVYPEYPPCMGNPGATSVAAVGDGIYLYARGDGTWFYKAPPYPMGWLFFQRPMTLTGGYAGLLPNGMTGVVSSRTNYGTTHGSAPVQGTVAKFITKTGSQIYTRNTDLCDPLPQGGCSPRDCLEPWRSRFVPIAHLTDGTMQQWVWPESGEYPDQIPSRSGCYTPPPSRDVVVKKVAHSGIHGLAIKNDGSLYTWGPTGSGYATVCEEQYNSVKWLTGLPSTGNFIDVDAGMHMVPQAAYELNPYCCQCCGYLTLWSAAVRDDGQLFTWGDNDHGILGPDTPENPWEYYVCSYSWQEMHDLSSNRPTDSELMSEGGCTAVFCGDRALGVITNNEKRAKVWGIPLPYWSNYWQQPGTFDQVPKNATNIKEMVILDPYCVVALKHDGTITGWGNISPIAFGLIYYVNQGWFPHNIGWNRMVAEDDILAENEIVGGIAEISKIGSQGVLIRRNNGTVKAYNVWPSGWVRYYYGSSGGFNYWSYC